VVVEFFGTTQAPIVWQAVPIALLAVLLAVWVGVALGRSLSRDLRMANHGVRMLGTDAALEGTRVMRPARFQVVADLGRATELLASRFRTFAQAQVRAIEARGAATRARGRFFASVSHDLKSPLNAILGFAELCKRDLGTNAAQRESLELIASRGRELLALIETILDAARVEAGQLQLLMAEERLGDILEDAIDRARALTGGREVLVTLEVPDDAPSLVVDRLRLAQALSTFIAHAIRTAERSTVRVLVDASPRDARPSLRRRRVTIHVEVPSAQFSAQELEAMVSPERHPGQHRGVALALRLAKAIVELHGGRVSVTGRTVKEPAFAIELRGRPGQ
jgi:signal transduction histidine kinase